MSVRSFECFPDDPLALVAVGDVLAARRVAREFLANATPPAYAAAELQMLTPASQSDLIGQLLWLVLPGGARAGEAAANTKTDINAHDAPK